MATERCTSQWNPRPFVSELRPEQKTKVIADHINKGNTLLMVGDGINDAPALTLASVSMAPAAASDIGRAAADIVYTRNGLEAVPFAIQVSRATQRIIKQNFGLALAYNCVAVPAAMAGMVTPLFAAIAMSTSSIIVVLNSLRLNLQTKKPINQ